MHENPIGILLMIAVGAYVAWLWWADFKAAKPGVPSPGQALPGATPASVKAIVLASVGAALILAAETWGEIALKLDDKQSKITILFGLHTLLAAIVEEIIFRGYLVVEKRGRAALYAGVFGASVLFSLMHPFLWKWDDEGFAFTLTAKGWLSFGAVFVGSLWFYVCRFASWNPQRSLLPCFAAHMTKNIGVFAIKAVQGYVVGVW